MLLESNGNWVVDEPPNAAQAAPEDVSAEYDL